MSSPRSPISLLLTLLPRFNRECTMPHLIQIALPARALNPHCTQRLQLPPYARNRIRSAHRASVGHGYVPVTDAFHNCSYFPGHPCRLALLLAPPDRVECDGTLRSAGIPSAKLVPLRRAPNHHTHHRFRNAGRIRGRDEGRDPRHLRQSPDRGHFPCDRSPGHHGRGLRAA